MTNINDTQYLQNLIDKGGDIVISSNDSRTSDAVYIITSPLVLSNGCHVTLDGCTLRLADGVYSNIFISKGAWDKNPAEVNDISITGINGAKLESGSPNGLTEKNSMKDGLPSIMNNTFILFRNVRRFKVSNLKLENPRYWCMTYYYCSDGEISDIEFKAANNVPNQDGIDLRRGCHDITIRNISGSTGDDTIALTALHHYMEQCFTISDMCCDIYNIDISNVSSEVTGGHAIVRLLCHDGIKLYNVNVSDVYDRHIDMKNSIRNNAGIRIGEDIYWTIKPAKTGDMSKIKVSRVTTNAKSPVRIYGEIPDLELSEITAIE